ncbi:uncharacterized protein LOC135394679 isoform X2 [Ornithodoros turicata]|uniref:uncharacterized protein LOC135394679 isoform X2 n=1 Tax=Ornithodoros turicata TaxID=34597 RepID=UPI0031391479
MTETRNVPPVDVSSSSPGEETPESVQVNGEQGNQQHNGWLLYTFASCAFVVLAIAVGIIILLLTRGYDPDSAEVPNKRTRRVEEMQLHQVCTKDSECDAAEFLTCRADPNGWEKACQCSVGYIEHHNKCIEIEMRPGDMCDLRHKCPKSTNMICDRSAEPPICLCMAGMRWIKNKCIPDFGKDFLCITCTLDNALILQKTRQQQKMTLATLLTSQVDLF